MSTITTPAPPMVLTPTGDRSPVEKAAVESIADGFDPETFLWITFWRPDGGAKVWYAWTAGGEQLGDRVDGLALAGGLDSADWLYLTGLSCLTSTRGRIETRAHPLRPLLRAVESGMRAPEEERAKLLRLLECASEMTGQPLRNPGSLPRWGGVGPHLLSSR
jgi:hypothetical protein